MAKDLVDDLVRILPPPKKPFGAASRSAVSEIEQLINLTLPEDFKQILRIYGAGQWQAFYYLVNPFFDAGRAQWQSPADDVASSTELSMMRFHREQDRIHDSNRVPYPIFPEDGGILPWALTENGGCIFWITDGGHAKWRSVYYDDGERYDRCEYDLSCSEILYGAVSGELPIFDSGHDGDKLPSLANSQPDEVFEPAGAT